MDPSVSRLRRVAVYGLSVALFAVLALLATSTYRNVQRDLSLSAVTGRSALATLAANTLSYEFERLTDIARSLASRVRFTELVAIERWQEAAQIMNRVPEELPGIDRILIVDLQGVVRATVPASSPYTGDYFPNEWRYSPELPLNSFVTELKSDSTNTDTHFLVATPITEDQRRPLALLALYTDASRLDELFSSLRPEENTMFYVLDQHGVIAYSLGQPASVGQRASSHSTVRRVLAGESGIVLDDRPLLDGGPSDNYLTAFAPSSHGWSVIAQWPQSTVFAARDAALTRLVLAMILLAIASVAAIALLMHGQSQRRRRAATEEANAQLEEHVRLRTAELERANAELESFSYSISHDLRAPLRAIDGYTKLLLESGGDHLLGDAGRYADNIHRNVSQMAQLIDELLELARVGRAALTYASVDMTALANEIANVLRSQYPTHEVVIDPLPEATADAAMMRQVWVNLIENAFKYSSRVAAPRIVVGGTSGNRENLYSIADNGAGFDMKHYDRLFKPFSRLHSPGEFVGTGVGLAIVKRIIDRHGGRIWAQSQDGVGTTIFFALPRPVGPA